MPSNTPIYIYIVFGYHSDDRTPFGSYQSRSAAESSIEDGSLEKTLEQHGLRLSDCDHYTVERWEVGRFLDDQHVKTLTSYDQHGNKMKSFEEFLES